MQSFQKLSDYMNKTYDGGKGGVAEIDSAIVLLEG